MNFVQWQRDAIRGPARFFSLARHALVAALQKAGIGEADRVLLPEFICRDVVAAIHAVGATAVWYPVGEDLRPAKPADEWADARAVLAVDYFGFDQPLAPFRAYAARTGALVIEDNAHGFLSRDDNGGWLGTRASFGIFSLRKTLPIPDGAMLVTNDAQSVDDLPEQLKESGRGFAPGVAVRAIVQHMPLLGATVANFMTAVVRKLRWLRTGHAIPPSDSESEWVIPGIAAPHRGLADTLSRLDVAGEINRRRTLYLAAKYVAASAGIEPLFSDFPVGVAPYGFPFRVRSFTSVEPLQRWSKSRGLELIGWPDLPDEIVKSAPDRYRNVRLVNFLC